MLLRSALVSHLSSVILYLLLLRCAFLCFALVLCVLPLRGVQMPFAKFTFDVIHISWVYHGKQPRELLTMFLEIHRILRPGGYIWMRGGWAHAQVTLLQNLLAKLLGYKILYSHIQEKPKMITESISFGENLPYQSDWWVIAVKPVAAHANPPEKCQTA
jgi:hypothetical protein